MTRPSLSSNWFHYSKKIHIYQGFHDKLTPSNFLTVGLNVRQIRNLLRHVFSFYRPERYRLFRLLLFQFLQLLPTLLNIQLQNHDENHKHSQPGNQNQNKHNGQYLSSFMRLLYGSSHIIARQKETVRENTLTVCASNTADAVTKMPFMLLILSPQACEIIHGRISVKIKIRILSRVCIFTGVIRQRFMPLRQLIQPRILAPDSRGGFVPQLLCRNAISPGTTARGLRPGRR